MTGEAHRLQPMGLVSAPHARQNAHSPRRAKCVIPAISSRARAACFSCPRILAHRYRPACSDADSGRSRVSAAL